MYDGHVEFILIDSEMACPIGTVIEGTSLDVRDGG